MTGTVWDDIPSVWITSFWGWSPDTWGTVGFTSAGRRDTVRRETSDPFIMVVYVTKRAPNRDPDFRGKVTGIYLVSHVEGHRDEFTAPEHHLRNPDQWIHSFKAVKAFSFLPEFRLDIDDFDPTLSTRARAVAQYAEEVKPALIEKLRALPFVEVPVYGGPETVAADITFPSSGRIGVRAGPVNRSGYSVPGEPLDTPKELYALRLTGDPSIWLGTAAEGRHIFKIGLSVSPKTRRDAFRKMLPEGVFTWDLFRSTRRDGFPPYPSFNAAEAGEWAMKQHLGREGQSLGGEFYAATMETFEAAWSSGRAAALAAAAGDVSE